VQIFQKTVGLNTYSPFSSRSRELGRVGKRDIEAVKDSEASCLKLMLANIVCRIHDDIT
jgi:hypothetical protein